MLAELTGVLRAYTRAFLSQGVGLVGLAWCLVETLPAASAALAALVLADQAIFLRGRRQAPDRGRPLRVALDAWCLAVSGADVLLCLATVLRSLGIQDGAGHAASDPLSSVALVLASFAHADLHLGASTGAGRIVVAVAALLGDAVLLGLLAGALRRRGHGGEGRSR